MTTVTEIAKASLYQILAEGADSPLEADEYEDYLNSLNWFMSALEARNIKLGFTTVTNLSDEVTVPPGAIRGIVANMAIEMAPMFGGTVTPALSEQARAGMKAMRKLGSKLRPAQLPVTLPRGSGNSQRDYNEQFYTTSEYATVTLSGNTNPTEIAALDTPVKVQGQWSLAAVAGLIADVSGRIRNISNTVFSAQTTITLDATCTTSDTYTFYLAKNGTVIAASAVSAALSTTPTSVSMSYLQALSPNDYLELFVEADTTTTDIIVVNAQFKAT